MQGQCSLFVTDQWVQCRNEQPFQAYIRILSSRADSLYDTPAIDCPTCGRRYLLAKQGDWVSDRPLIFLSNNEVAEARKHAIGWIKEVTVEYNEVPIPALYRYTGLGEALREAHTKGTAIKVVASKLDEVPHIRRAFRNAALGLHIKGCHVKVNGLTVIGWY